MYQIICPVCNNPNAFEAIESRPVECSFCFTTFDATLPAVEIATLNVGKLCGLKLVYQQNSESIDIKENSCILGRENTGAKLLSNIIVNGVPVISRKHCSISLIDGKYYLKDEGSVNGTFNGVSKIDCSKDAQIIEDKSIIFLGKEAFLVQYQFQESVSVEKQEVPPKENDADKPKKYRCNEGCGFESETYLEICSKCMTSNSMVEIR